MNHHSIFLKAYHCPDGRTIHYSAARLHEDPSATTGTSILDIDIHNDANHGDNDIKNCPCWVFFSPAGPNRRLLDAIVSRYASHFQCLKDVIFLCVTRPGKGGTSSSGLAKLSSSKNGNSKDADNENCNTREKLHVATACRDVVAILDHYQISKTSLMYMCAGSTFAYSFAAMFPERTTGNIIGISSWILRYDPTTSTSSSSSSDSIPTQPQMYTLTHKMAMKGFFGPKWMVSSLAGGIVNSATGLLSMLPKDFAEGRFQKCLSDREKSEWEKQFPKTDEEKSGFIDVMNWIHTDGESGVGSVFVNVPASPSEDEKGDYEAVGCNIHIHCNGSGGTPAENTERNDGDAMDIAVCLSTQQELGMVYNTSVPPQQNVLLWHGENDTMISAEGSEWLAKVIPGGASLTKVPGGTHQGTMFFFPEDVMEALNRLSENGGVEEVAVDDDDGEHCYDNDNGPVGQTV
mmetsp:Transcript_28701/g.60891  ORF Transcript_28701/g.60891 Transcript_28701/m.60891 type:complete len:461 (+) Transcript_28701:11-1393(+)